MSALTDWSEGLADAVRAVRDSVVAVHGRRAPTSGLVWTDELVVTVCHGLRGLETVLVVLAGGEERSAEVVGRARGLDLALLRVEGGGLTPATWATEVPRVGAIVLPVGAASGRVRATFGMLSDVGGPWQTAAGLQVESWLDVDGSLPSGFQGGPLVDATGRVLGLNTAGLTPTGAVLPQATVERVATRLRDHGSAAPGYLGVGFYPGTLPDAVAATAGQPDALMAVSLEPGGPGEHAGVQVGDALVRIDGLSITGLRHLMGTLGAKGAGADVVLTVVRAGQVVDVPVGLSARPPRGRC
jgi:S1-C subfamily serine protease